MNWINNNGLIIWAAVSALITVIHTIDESDGKLWDEIGIPQWSYFMFQGAVLMLGLVTWVNPGLALSLVTVRITDAVYTHLIRALPGTNTAAWLFLDAAVILTLME